MEFTEKQDALKHIKLGTKEVFYYDYDGNPLPLRPISSYELDDCFYKALEFATNEMADLIVKLRLKLFKKEEEVDFTDKDYISLQKHYDAISYWVVFHSMKDFQDEDFKKPTFVDAEILPQGMFKVRKMNYVHDMAKIVLDSSYRPKDFIKEIIKDKWGKDVAYCVFYLNVPLAEFNSLTELQRDYLIYSKGELQKVKASDSKEKSYIFSGKKLTKKDFLRKFYNRVIE